MIFSVTSPCLNLCASVFICGSSTVSFRLGQVVINHPAAILLCFGHRGVTAFFVAADLVLGVEAFENELARGYHLRVIRTLESEGNHCRIDQLGNGFE